MQPSIFCFFIFLILIFNASEARGECGTSYTQDASVALKLSGTTLRVGHTILTKEMGEAIIQRIKSNSVQVLILECIPGGSVSVGYELFRLAQGLEVHVRHTCNSACAKIALGAKKLVLLDSGNVEIPTSMFIHATFDAKTQKATLHALEDLNFYSVRLAGVVDREKIAAALSETRVGNYGLVIVRDSNHIFKSKNNAIYHCTPYPKNCIPVEGSAFNKLARVFKE